MTDNFYNKKERTSFRDIVLQHLKRILELSTLEFKGGYNHNVVRGNISEIVYVPDTRKCYIQAIESLADVLIPHYDKIMEADNKKYGEDDVKLLKELEEAKEKIKDRRGYVPQYIKRKLPLARKLFQQLNRLLKRIEYLKSALYAEEEEEQPENAVEELDK